MKGFLPIIFIVVILPFLFQNVDGFTPIVTLTINGTHTSNHASDFRDVRSITPQFNIEKYPSSIFVGGNFLDDRSVDSIVTIRDPTGKLFEYETRIDFGNLEFLISIEKESPIGVYTFFIGSPENSVASASFEILSNQKTNDDESKIPPWVKNIFVWYGQDKISEDDLLRAIEYLVNQGIIKISNYSIDSSTNEPLTIESFDITIQNFGDPFIITWLITSENLDKLDAQKSENLRNLIVQSKMNSAPTKPIDSFLPPVAQTSSMITITAFTDNGMKISKEFYSNSIIHDLGTEELLGAIWDIERNHKQLLEVPHRPVPEIVESFTIDIISSGGEQPIFENFSISSFYLDQENPEIATKIRKLIIESKIDYVAFPPICCDHIFHDIKIIADISDGQTIQKSFDGHTPYQNNSDLMDVSTIDLISMVFEVKSLYKDSQLN